MNVLVGVISPAPAWVMPRRVRRSAAPRFSAHTLPRRLGSRGDPPPAARGRRRLHAVRRSRHLPVGDAPAMGPEPGGRRRQPDVSRAAREPGRADERARHPRALDRRARARRHDRARPSSAARPCGAGRASMGAGGARGPRGVRTLQGQRMGIVGLGAIGGRGRAIAAPFGFRVIGDSPPRGRAAARRRRGGLAAGPLARSARAERRRRARGAAYAGDQAADRPRARSTA